MIKISKDEICDQYDIATFMQHKCIKVNRQFEWSMFANIEHPRQKSILAYFPSFLAHEDDLLDECDSRLSISEVDLY